MPVPGTTAGVRQVLATPDDEVAKPRLALGLLIGFALANLAVRFLTTALTPYGIHRDEFLYLAMGEHLRFWRMDYPPALAVLGKFSRALFGDNLFAIRFSPAIASTLLLATTGLIALELGGRRFAQGLAMLTVALSALFLRPGSLFQPVIWDQLWWTVGLLALIKIAQAGEPRWWLLLGLAGGLGLLTKFSIGFFAVGVMIGLLLGPERRSLGTRWPFVAALLALVIGSASIVGQVRLGFPVFSHMHELQTQQLQRLSYGDYFAGQVLLFGPALVLALLGAVFLGSSERMRPYRTIVWVCATAFFVLLVLHGKAYYIGPIYPTLFAAGASALELKCGATGTWARITLVVLILAWAGIGLPFGLPIVPPEPMARYAAAIGLKGAVTTNRGAKLPLPQDYADMLGWDEQVSAVARCYSALEGEKRAEAVLIARNYGEAGALEFLGPRHGLPQRVLLPGTNILWFPRTERPCEVAVTIGIPFERLSRYFRSVKVVAEFDHPWMVPEERHQPICVAEEPTAELEAMWLRGRR